MVLARLTRRKSWTRAHRLHCAGGPGDWLPPPAEHVCTFGHAGTKEGPVNQWQPTCGAEAQGRSRVGTAQKAVGPAEKQLDAGGGTALVGRALVSMCGPVAGATASQGKGAVKRGSTPRRRGVSGRRSGDRGCERGATHATEMCALGPDGRWA